MRRSQPCSPISISLGIYAAIAFDDDPAARPLLDDVSATTGPVRLGPVMGDGYIAFTVNEVEAGGRYQGIVN